MSLQRRIAIIGIGPRGSWALENYVKHLMANDSLTNIHILLFEATGKYGYGPVYGIEQIDSNWINVSERFICIDERKSIKSNNITIPAFPSFHSWTDKDFASRSKSKTDYYPPRSKIGHYLKERFQTLLTPLIEANIVSIIEEEVIDVTMIDQSHLHIVSKENTYKNINEVLLTIGHQPTHLDDQLQHWSKFAHHNSHELIESPYPIDYYLERINITRETQIGIRGFGLAMIDVARAVANKVGTFMITNERTKTCRYKPSEPLRDLIIPFSLDGLPPAPKPLNAAIDEWFQPTGEMLSKFESNIGNKATQKSATSPDFLIQAFAPIAAKIYLRLTNYRGKGELSENEIESIVVSWLKDNSYEHSTIIPATQDAYSIMKATVGMAIGEDRISLDYCIGQVWRHCQPTIYKALSFNHCAEEVCAEIIALDESTKRYSYGPPVESIQQMIALVDANIMTLEVVCDPSFELSKKGWNIKNKGHNKTATMMINSVLPPPKIKTVNSPLVKNLLSDNLIQAVHDDLGVDTDEYGFVRSKDIDNKIPLALLGRLAKGTIIGVDALMECYGDRPARWAHQAAKNHEEWMASNIVSN